MKDSRDDLFLRCKRTLLRQAAYARRKDPRCELSPSSIVQDAWIRLHQAPEAAGVSDAALRAIAMHAMNNIVIDAMRKRLALRRGGRDRIQVTLDEDAERVCYSAETMLDFSRALDRLKERDPTQHTIGMLTWFGGFGAREVAADLGLTEAVIRHELRALRGWRNSLLQDEARASRA